MKPLIDWFVFACGFDYLLGNNSSPERTRRGYLNATKIRYFRSQINI
jgi:hypothetical protein